MSGDDGQLGGLCNRIVGLRDGMILVKREAGTPGDSRVELAYRVKVDGSERVIRYKPEGKERLRAQEVRLNPGADLDSEECRRSLSGIAVA